MKCLKKYNEIWEKASKSIKKDIDSEPVYNKKYLKAKINLIMEQLTQIFIIIK